MVTLIPGETAWTEKASLPRSLYAPRASLVGGKMRLTGGRSTDGQRDYRDKVTISHFLVRPPSLFLNPRPTSWKMSHNFLVPRDSSHDLMFFSYNYVSVLFSSGAWVWYEQMGWGWKNEHCKRVPCCSIGWTKGFALPWTKLKTNNIVFEYVIKQEF